MTVTVRYFAGARAAAGVTEEKVSAANLGELRARLADLHGERLSTVLRSCSFLVDGTSTRDDSASLSTGVTVDVLPPFAGG